MMSSCPLYLSGTILFTFSTSLILLTKETIASNKPIGTAIVKLTKTVNKKVVTSTNESPVRNFNMEANDLYSLILNATTIKIGAMLASGIRSEEHTSELQSRGHLVRRLL